MTSPREVSNKTDILGIVVDEAEQPTVSMANRRELQTKALDTAFGRLDEATASRDRSEAILRSLKLIRNAVIGNKARKVALCQNQDYLRRYVPTMYTRQNCDTSNSECTACFTSRPKLPEKNVTARSRSKQPLF